MAFWDNIFKKKSKPMVFPVGEGLNPEQTQKAQEVIATKPVEKPKSSFWNDILAPKKAMQFRVGEGLPEPEAIKAAEAVRTIDATSAKPSLLSQASYYNPNRQSFFNKISTSLSTLTSPTATKEEKQVALDEFSTPIIGATSGLNTITSKLLGQGKTIPKSFLNFLAKEKSAVNIEKSLTQQGIDQATAREVAPRLSFSNTIDDVKNVLGEYGNKAKSQIKDQISMIDDMLREHPGKILNKRVSRTTGLLPEVTGARTMKSLTGSGKDVKTSDFGRRGDSITQELSQDYYGTPDKSGQEIVDEYKALVEQRNELREQLKLQDDDIVKKALDANEKRLIEEGYIKPPHLKFDADGNPLAYTAREKAIVSQSQIPKPSQLDTTTGEGRSLEKLAIQEQGALDVAKIPKDVVDDSLVKIITKEPTPVNKKVNIIDYIRTPDRVLKKIGLEEEAKFLRSNYEAYLKELPKNIEKITEWSKRASPTGNKDIFRWLDGEAITLKPEDQKIATEIRSWLRDWAKRLGLPDDNTITHYITHIFDDQLIAKEFDEDLAKLIDNKLPGQVYDPFLEKRLGKTGYKQDTWAALDAYVKRATRKVNLDPALEQIKDASGKLEKSQLEFVQSYINSINMRPNKFDSLLDNGIKQLIGYRLGQRPTLAVTKFLRQMTYRAMLGGNISSALKNISQGINTYAKLGEKYTTLGYINLFKRGAKAELEAEGILNAGFIEDRALSSTKKILEKFDKTLFYFFEKAEHINRGAAYFGAKAQGLKKGMSEKEAIEYGKKIVRDTQFTFGKIDTPLILSSDIGKTIGQFQSFTTKQFEFLGEMAKAAMKGDQKAKNFIGLLRYAMAGTLFVYTVGKAFGMDIKDLIPSFRFGTPPSLKLPVEAGKALLNTPDKYNQPRDLERKLKDVGNAAIGIIPGGIQAKKTIQGIQALNKGRVEDTSGRAKYDVGGTPLKDLQTLIFGKYVGQGARNYYDKDLNYAEQKLEQIRNSKTGKEDLLKIIKEEPTLAKNIVQVLKDQAAGITDEDKTLKNMGVANKQRAKEIAKQLNKLKTKEEKKVLVATYIQKKIITPEVAGQLIEFLNK